MAGIHTSIEVPTTAVGAARMRFIHVKMRIGVRPSPVCYAFGHVILVMGILSALRWW